MAVRLVAWTDDDLGLLRRINTPEMTEFLGGPESEAKVAARHRRYLTLEDGLMFRIELDGEAAGSIGFWPIQWQGEPVFETGWSVLPQFQGRGVAVAAAAAVVGKTSGRSSLHAFPKVAHAASNAVCRKAGFSLVGECDFEYPVGNPIRCNDWRVTVAP